MNGKERVNLFKVIEKMNLVNLHLILMLREYGFTFQNLTGQRYSSPDFMTSSIMTEYRL